MPIYAYKCSSCGHAQDVLQKVSDAPLTDCPQCQAATFSKQLTAAGFQLRGSGWYATDFKNGSGKRGDKTEPKGSEAPAAAKTEAPKTEAAAGTGGGSCGHGGCSACS
jgi:putative FmdB family regulatory protein